IRAPYLLPFDTSHALQDTLPQLVRSGALVPVSLSRPASLPGWANGAVLAPDENATGRQFDEQLQLLATQCAGLSTARWAQWQTIAFPCARLTRLRHAPEGNLTRRQLSNYALWQGRLDGAFLDWLQSYYAPLAGTKLPQPHHLYHVPHYIAYQRRQLNRQRVALLVLDGLSLADWLLIAETWRGRWREWHFSEQ